MSITMYNALGLNEHEVSLIKSIPVLNNIVIESRAIQIAKYFLLISEKFNIEQVKDLKVVPYSEQYTIVSIHFESVLFAFPLLLSSKVLTGNAFDHEFEKNLKTAASQYETWLKLSKKGTKRIKISQLLFKKTGSTISKRSY